MAIDDALTNALEGGISGIDKVLSNNQNQQQFVKEGFIVPPTASADGNGLPSSKIPANRNAISRRHIMHFFVPEVGVINMYINPQNINYSFKKIIQQNRTKGGYVVQYWGEELPTLSISGHTASAGIEGLNVLYEVYRSEQLTFDSVGLTIASNSANSGIGDLFDSAIGQLAGSGAIGGLLSTGVNDFLGLSPISQTLLPRNINTLASLAFGMEIYYNGWVFRGFFTSFNFKESVDRLGLFDYDMNFTVTQRRGYRTNYLPWQRSANSGPSNSVEGGIPLSFGKDFEWRPGRNNR